ncbi:MAG TPA: hypothetical protein VFS21_14305 [Roseiflexaceae bacterium]|nr:hypothetical protein [Roseiflexaceae bacterium]
MSEFQQPWRLPETSPRLPLWERLERAHLALGWPAPTATLLIEELEVEVARVEVLVAAGGAPAANSPL